MKAKKEESSVKTDAPRSAKMTQETTAGGSLKKKVSMPQAKKKPPTVPVSKSSPTTLNPSAGRHPYSLPSGVDATDKNARERPPKPANAPLAPTAGCDDGACSEPSSAKSIPTTSSATPSLQNSTAALLARPSSTRKTAFVVVDHGVTAEQGTRRTMEDQHTMLAEGIPFFGVYDGHGGTQCAEYLRDHLHGFIFSNPELKTNPRKAIVDGIVEADNAFLALSERETNESGSVCAVALIIDDKLVVGNVGDCEAVLARDGKPVVLTVRHTIASNPSEEERVRGVGGKVCHNRVGHPNYNPAVVSLAVTRAIGDAGFKLARYTDGKASGVIAVPDTTVTKLTDDDEFLVIGCDGLWDVMTYEEVVDFCYRRFQEGMTAQCIAEELAQAALAKGSTDNVTAMLVHLTRREGLQSTREFVPEAAVSTSTRNLSEEP
ncbi:protein phosphatase 2C-like protein [Leptomonas pyrrhocoris]|uniref:Protein phosphatase 2C-like protein n=1 Tax=Leptomonas pyrrhocoris TaxID=157538 RepID=A0A0M9G4X5_LEPPY|nr:protein phosphatase 2C-like protein [Leptomonas pyrrhocoris]KPA82317.1 protein phosphatase 2C-like protein [Leptomonas pyrrhocoris]|eukprot:XP_015660756.1 protein phosphatase 2C-like protein [Leptomonas pyrrhocoris]